MKSKVQFSFKIFTLICVMSIFQFSFAQSGFDPNFGQGGEVVTIFNGKSTNIEAITQLADNKIIAAGSIYDENEDEESGLVLRYLVDGSIDNSFGVNGSTSVRFNNSDIFFEELKVDNSGRIYMVGEIAIGDDNYSATLSRLTANGAIDNTFGNNGSIVTTFGTTFDATATNLAIQNNGKIILAGFVSDYNDNTNVEIGDFALARYNINGTLDTSFGTNGYVITAFAPTDIDGITDIALQPNGKIIALGISYSQISDSSDIAIARYNIDGSLDTTFANGTGKTTISIGTYDNIAAITLQPDGKILLSGEVIFEASGLNESLILRLNNDGSPDTSFNNNGFVITSFLDSTDNSSSSHSIFVNADGSILSVGSASDREGIEFERYIVFAKYTANGTLDTSFRGDGKFLVRDDTIYSNNAIITNAGKLLIAGEKTISDSGNLLSDAYLAQFLLDNVLEIEDFNSKFISFYPNPVKDVLILNFSTSANNTEIALYDMIGKVVLNKITSANNETLNVSNLSNGVYFLKVSQNGNTSTEKIVKN